MKRDLLRHKLITIDDKQEVGSAQPLFNFKAGNASRLFNPLVHLSPY
ncbi:hypothetical protein [Limosilactobacillus antri]|nr:hypothetical protein [Limosilactobacillus antri]